MKWLLTLVFGISTLLFWSDSIWAQVSEEDFEVQEIEKEIRGQPAKPVPPQNQGAWTENQERLSELRSLVPFSEIAIIQKRYQPKTNRFQFYGGVASIVNDPWFFDTGLNGRAAYHLNEAFGIEASFLYLTSGKRTVTNELLQENSVAATSLISTKNYFGMDLVWTPIYGKMGLSNRLIIPFDMYFSIGGGVTGVEAGEGGPTLHLGAGQIFAISKSVGFRWDFSWNAFQGKPAAQELDRQVFNNLLLTFGMSFFYPEVSSR